jgi:ABC-type nickel/cobalt efflux system permease component RcnA
MKPHRPSAKAYLVAICDRLNDGLTAVAVVLAALVMIVGTYRTAEEAADMMQAESAPAAGDATTP